MADSGNHRIRAVNPNTGDVRTLCGNGQLGHKDGPGSSAQFNYPVAVAVDADGTLFPAERWEQLRRKVTTARELLRVASQQLIEAPNLVQIFGPATADENGKTTERTKLVKALKQRGQGSISVLRWDGAPTSNKVLCFPPIFKPISPRETTTVLLDLQKMQGAS